MFDDIRIQYLAHPLTSGGLVFVAGAMFGAFLNYFYGVRLARRTEFNSLADPARGALRKELENPSPFAIAPVELDALVDHLSFYKRPSYNVALEKYKEAHTQNWVHDEMYGPVATYSRIDHIEDAIRVLLPYLKRR